MTFFFDKSFKQAIESNSKTVDKQSVVTLLHQSKIILVQAQNSSITHKNHLRSTLKIQAGLSFNYFTDFNCFITESVNCV